MSRQETGQRSASARTVWIGSAAAPKPRTVVDLMKSRREQDCQSPLMAEAEWFGGIKGRFVGAFKDNGRTQAQPLPDHSGWARPQNQPARTLLSFSRRKRREGIVRFVLIPKRHRGHVVFQRQIPPAGLPAQRLYG